MSEFNSSSDLSRILSCGSQEVVRAISEDKSGFIDEETLVFALQAIKLAFIATRINEDEKISLQRSMVERAPFDPTIMAKLSRGERFALEEIDSSVFVRDCSDEEVASLQVEVTDLKQEVEKIKAEPLNASIISSTQMCSICFNEFPAQEGLCCENSHFQCSSCITLWCEVLNAQKESNSDLLRQREGLLKCPYDGCSYVYSKGQICSHILSDRTDVLDDFLDNLSYLESLKAYANYQEKLMELTQEMREAEKLSGAGPALHDVNDGGVVDAKPLGDSTDESAAARLRKRIELESLAQTLKSQLPDARMCAKCGFGKIFPPP